MNQGRNIVAWFGVLALLLVLFSVLYDDFGKTGQNIVFSDFLTRVANKEVVSARIYGNNVEGQMNDGTFFTTYGMDMPHVVEKLQDSGATIEVVAPDTKMNSFLSILISWFPILLFIGVWVFFMRQVGSGAGKAMGFGKSKAKLLSEKGTKVTFKDVAGIDEAKEELTEIVDFLRAPAKFQKIGGRIPKGCLLIGSPGTGKTLLARAIAGEANVPFFSISGSDFVEMFVGVGASRVRDMFEQARRSAPCIIFIDEIDAVGRNRGNGFAGSNDEREQTLNQLLVEMDGFETTEGVVIIAATNRPDVLDSALLRPGRFDRRISIPHPDLNGREQILLVHLKKVQCAAELDVRKIARGTPGFSGAELANLVNEAALVAARHNKKEVDLEALEESKDKIILGIAQRSKIINPEQQKFTAYHEAGHAIVGLYLKASDPIYKVTVIPRGGAAGLVARLPENERIPMSREKLMSHLATAMGGRIAEEMIFGYNNVTTGASQDIKVASYFAREMVTKYGFSDKLGPINYEPDDQAWIKDNKHANDTNMLIDSEVRHLIDTACYIARRILTENLDKMHILVEKLVELETLNEDQVKNLLKYDPNDAYNIVMDKPPYLENVKSATEKKEPKKTSSRKKASEGEA